MRRASALMLLSPIALGACAPTSSDYPVADEAECAVYRAFYGSMPIPAPVFVRKLASGRPDDLTGKAPTRFDATTWNHLGQVYDIGPVPPSGREEFSESTTPYFDQLVSKPAYSIESCFSDGGPRFVEGAYGALLLRERQLSGNRNAEVDIRTVSPVAISSGGDHALLYEEHHCGSLCGSGAYYLLRKQAGQWVVIGEDLIWIS